MSKDSLSKGQRLASHAFAISSVVMLAVAALSLGPLYNHIVLLCGEIVVIPRNTAYRALWVAMDLCNTLAFACVSFGFKGEVHTSTPFSQRLSRSLVVGGSLIIFHELLHEFGMWAVYASPKPPTPVEYPEFDVTMSGFGLLLICLAVIFSYVRNLWSDSESMV